MMILVHWQRFRKVLCNWDHLKSRVLGFLDLCENVELLVGTLLTASGICRDLKTSLWFLPVTLVQHVSHLIPDGYIVSGICVSLAVEEYGSVAYFADPRKCCILLRVCGDITPSTVEDLKRETKSVWEFLMRTLYKVGYHSVAIDNPLEKAVDHHAALETTSYRKRNLCKRALTIANIHGCECRWLRRLRMQKLICELEALGGNQNAVPRSKTKKKRRSKKRSLQDVNMMQLVELVEKNSSWEVIIPDKKLHYSSYLRGISVDEASMGAILEILSESLLDQANS